MRLTFSSEKCLNMCTCYYCSYSTDQNNQKEHILKQLKGNTKISGSSAATKFGVKLGLFVTVMGKRFISIGCLEIRNEYNVPILTVLNI